MTAVGPPSALIVEEQPLILGLVRSIVSSLGFDPVHFAERSDAALESFLDNVPDLVITARGLEPFDGETLVRKLRDTVDSPHPCVPIIFMSEFGASEEVISIRDAGVNEVVAKPVTTGVLFRRIHDVVLQPRRFIMCGSYFGPDRRRKQKDYKTEERRRARAIPEISNSTDLSAHRIFVEELRKRMGGV